MADEQPTPEEWRPVLGYEALYEVSDHGRVRSLDRQSANAGGTYTRRGRMMRPTTKDSGHLYVSLWKDSAVKKAKVHRLVLEAFVGLAPAGMECCHWNDIPADNRLTNLRWATSTDNKFDAVRNGTHFNTRKTHCKRGHLFAGANLQMRHDGRYCRACDKARKYINRMPHLKPYFDQVADQKYLELTKEQA